MIERIPSIDSYFNIPRSRAEELIETIQNGYAEELAKVYYERRKHR